MSKDDARSRHEAEAGLQTERDLIAAVLDTVGALVVVLDREGRIVRFNQACEQVTGYASEEALGRCFWEFLLIPAEVEPVKATFQALRAGAFPNQLDNYWVAKDGSRRLIAWTNTAIVGGTGLVEYVIGTGIDITDRKRAEEEREWLLAEARRERQRAERLAASLEHERSTLEVVVESTHTQIAYLDPEFNFVLVNSAYGRGSGHAPAEMIGRNHFALFPDAENQAIFERVRNSGEAVRFTAKPFEYADQPERGVTYWDWSLVPVRNATGQVQGLVLSLLDVTQQVKALVRIEALSAQSQQQADELTAILNAIPDPVAVWNAQGVLLRANPAAVAALGIDPVGLAVDDLGHRMRARHPDGRMISPDDLAVARALRGETARHEYETLLTANGEEHAIVASAAPITPGGRVAGAVVAWHDITDLRRTEAALRRARDELTTLLDISNTVALTIDLEPLLALILDRLRDVVDYDGGAAFRLEGGRLSSVFHRGAIQPDDLLHIGSHLEEAVLGPAVIQGMERVIISDVQGDAALREAFRQAAGAEFEDMSRAVRAWMAIPVTIKQQVYGVLYMYHARPGRYGEEQARLALPFGNQAAVAIENARLYEQAQALAALEERQHLARELHDAVTQTLFSASLAAEVLPRLWERDREAGERALTEVHQLTRGALAEMRTLLLELRPAALVETELGALLNQLAEATTSRARIPVTVEAAPHCVLPAEVQVALYRITQEALNNVTKHAEARQVKVDLQCKAPWPASEGETPWTAVELRVIDDGRGFDPAIQGGGHRGLGLGIMRERAGAIGAAIRICSRPGQGTSITLAWPEEK